MRTALTTTALLAVLGTAPALMATTAAAAPAAAPSTVQLASGADVDEPLEQDGDDDTGKYGLIGLSGMLGLFGYKKYRDTRSARRPGDDMDEDGSGSKRI